MTEPYKLTKRTDADRADYYFREFIKVQAQLLALRPKSPYYASETTGCLQCFWCHCMDIEDHDDDCAWLLSAPA